MCFPTPQAYPEPLTWLQHHLLVLKRPRVADIFKRQLQDLGNESVIQPIKAALYFENVEGFGEWRILLSTEAQKYLRGARRSDGAIFKITVKKIK